MANQYLGQISPFAFTFAPNGWALCNGQVLSIAQNTALFSLIGTTYGGNGISTFQLPNLQGAVPIMLGSQYSLGQVGGEANHTLTTAEMPSHTHSLLGSSAAATSDSAIGNFPAAQTTEPYSTASPTLPLGNGTGTLAGGQPHNNMQPYLVINYCIALVGVFPTRS